MSTHTDPTHRVRWCFHATAMVADYEHTRDALTRLIGLRVLEDSRIEDPAIGRRGGMAWVGDNIIEVGEPIVEGGAVDRFVKRFGSHMSSIAVQVADTDATIDFLTEHGVRVASRIDGHIVFTNPADTAGVVIEWFGAEEPLDPRFGAPMPSPIVDPVLSVQAIAFAGAVVADPINAAQRLATLFDRDITFADANAPAGHPVVGVSMGDMTLAVYPIPPAEESERLWGWRYTRAQTNNLGVLVADLATALEDLCRAGVKVLRSDAKSIVIPPSETGGVTIVVVDELLPGDPRR
jgi:catechol 2,3-dioxygenase-like lactoylglutathione lyase family enzyme